MTDEPQPWWLRALEPLRSEAAMFRVLIWVVIAFVAILVVIVLARTLF